MNNDGLREKFVAALAATVELYDSVLTDAKARMTAIEAENEKLWKELRSQKQEIDILFKRLGDHERAHIATKAEESEGRS